MQSWVIELSQQPNRSKEAHLQACGAIPGRDSRPEWTYRVTNNEMWRMKVFATRLFGRLLSAVPPGHRLTIMSLSHKWRRARLSASAYSWHRYGWFSCLVVGKSNSLASVANKRMWHSEQGRRLVRTRAEKELYGDGDETGHLR